jgi:flagellar biosynthetic protein FliR
MNDLYNLLSQLLLGLAPLDALLLFMLIFTRWSVMTTMMPFLGGQLLPSPLRVALASMLSINSFILLMNKTSIINDLDIFLLGLLFLKEALLGFILGFCASLIFYVYELFGELIDFARAASMAKLMVPELKHQSSSMGTLLFQLALVLFFGLGFHREIIANAYQSFELFPIFSMNPNFLHDDFFMLAIEMLGTVFELAFKFALPVIFISFLIDLAFGLMNRVAPQINAYFLSLPAKIIGGLGMAFFILPFAFEDFADHHHDLLRFFLIFLGVNQ